jgi:hypothetical protein
MVKVGPAEMTKRSAFVTIRCHVNAEGFEVASCRKPPVQLARC